MVETSMRTDEDFLRLEAENRLLRESLNTGPEIAAELKRGIAGLLAPGTRERPEVLILLRVLASSAGLPALCERRECRRKGACLAEDNPPPCRGHWSKNLSARFEDMAVGMELSALCRQEEEADFRAWACEQLGLAPDDKVSPGKPGRKGQPGVAHDGAPTRRPATPDLIRGSARP